MTKKGRIFISLLGTIFILFGASMIYLNLQVIRHGQRLEGYVVGYESREQTSPGRGTSGTTDAPIVEFEYDGDTFQIPSQMSSAWHGFKVGDPVTLYFDPAVQFDQAEVILDSFYHKYGFGTLFLLCGILQFLTLWAMGKSGRDQK